MQTEINLKIAEQIISLKSDFPLQRITKRVKEFIRAERFDNFIYRGSRPPDIQIKINIVKKLPNISADTIFVTRHFQNGKENWRLLKRGDKYIYKSRLEDKTQLMLINNNFNRVEAYLLPKEQNGPFQPAWSLSDIIYDFLQVLLINYFAQRKKGIFTHSVGIKDIDGRGLLFAGKSGAGKSTTARLWHKNTNSCILNDDRVIICKEDNDKFSIYGSPWHGDFSDYLESRIESAALDKIFFIRHSRKNTARRLSYKEAFNLLYPALFPAFWDKELLTNIVSFSDELIRNIPCFSFGFVKNKKAIAFARRVCISSNTKISA